VFFYHGENDIDSGLVPKLLNAIHVSVFVAIAFFYFLKQENKSNWHYVAQFLLFTFLILLSSKNIILVVLFLVILDFFYFSKIANKMRLRNLFVFVAIVAALFSFGNLKERFEVELNTNTGKSLSANVLKKLPNGVHNVSIAEAWTNETFTSNDYFPGTAFRVYQARMFFEIMSENNKWVSGFGLNASQVMLEKKGIEYQIYLGDSTNEGYQKKNFHNQYLQIFAELGLFGLLLLLVMLGWSLKTAIKNKDFVAIAFTILMISLFLTESFLWRQRGVLFFTVFYVLFNAKPEKEVYKKNHK
jgi:O-antigen ligase